MTRPSHHSNVHGLFIQLHVPATSPSDPSGDGTSFTPSGDVTPSRPAGDVTPSGPNGVAQDELIESLRSEGRRQAAHRMLKHKRDVTHGTTDEDGPSGSAATAD